MKALERRHYKMLKAIRLMTEVLYPYVDEDETGDVRLNEELVLALGQIAGICERAMGSFDESDRAGGSEEGGV